MSRDRRPARVAPEHVDFWDTMREFFRAEIEPLLPQTGTITGDDGRLRVIKDGQTEATPLGFARNKGIRHQAGDRVLTMPTPGGERVVISVLSTSDGPAGRRAVGNTELFDNAVDNRALAAQSVNTEQLRQNSVVRGHLTTGIIATEHIGGSAVDTANLRTNSVNRDKIAPGAVGSTELGANAVGSANIAGNSVNRDKIAPSAVGSAELGTSAVDTPKLANGAVNNDKIANSAVDGAKIASGAVTPNKLDRAYAPANHSHPSPAITVTYKGKSTPLQTAINDINARLEKAGF